MGEKVATSLAIPHDVWQFTDEFRLVSGSERHYFRGDVVADSLHVVRNMTLSNLGSMDSDLPFRIDRESDRYIKNSRKYGLIADDEVLYEEFPELVQWKVVSGSETSKIGIDTTSYIGMLHGVVKELVNKVEVLQAQISGSSDYNALKAAVSSSG